MKTQKENNNEYNKLNSKDKLQFLKNLGREGFVKFMRNRQ